MEMARFFGKAEIEEASLTAVGRVRRQNEDAVGDPHILAHLIGENVHLAKRGRLYAVADGMGGHVRGEVASQMAIETLFQTLYSLTLDPISALRQSIIAANAAVYAAGTEQPAVVEELSRPLAGTDESERFSREPALASNRAAPSNPAANPDHREAKHPRMGTTLVAALMCEEQLYLGNVGDSRAYLLRKGQLSQLTEDHSLIAEEVRLGVLTAEEAFRAPFKNVITRAVGFRPEVEADFRQIALLAGDVLLLCSDGLHSVVEPEAIRQALEKLAPHKAARYLIDTANAKGGPDNISVVIVKFNRF
ncbi:MAG TPA: protein phosphatase 2C domain-containing protein [Chloroflexia bacterium]|nr:protein phosphatase 2C domain-containing protein [Chloroflexia bacterium]